MRAMLKPGDRFENPRTGASFEVLRAPSDGERTLEVKRVIQPGTGRTLPHVHFDYVERFAVEQGCAEAKLDGRTVELGPGDEFEVPLESSHVNPYNRGAEPLVMRHAFEPVSDFALGYVETLGHLMREGRTDKQGEVPVPAAFAIADATDSRTFAAGVPQWL